MTLKKYIKSNRGSLTHLSKRTKISISFLSRIVSGQRRPSPEYALAIEKATKGMVSRMDLLYPSD